jgi:hypothetical protein
MPSDPSGNLVRPGHCQQMGPLRRAGPRDTEGWSPNSQRVPWSSSHRAEEVIRWQVRGQLHPGSWRRLTARSGTGQHSSVRRLTALFTIVLALSGGIPADCVGWQATAAGRMECCIRAEHACANQVSADNCCGRTEQQRNQQPAGQLFVTPVPVMTTFELAACDASAAAIASAAMAFESTLHGRPVRPPYILTATLLI